MLDTRCTSTCSAQGTDGRVVSIDQVYMDESLRYHTVDYKYYWENYGTSTGEVRDNYERSSVN